MSKHTPGPWKVAGQGESGTQQLPIYGGGNIIAAIRDQGSLADARLIAAAPEMLFHVRGDAESKCLAPTFDPYADCGNCRTCVARALMAKINEGE